MSDSTKSMLSGIYEMGKSVREYIDQNGGGGGGSSTFAGLTDTPSTLTEGSGQYLKVSDDGQTIEYVDLPAGSIGGSSSGGGINSNPAISALSNFTGILPDSILLNNNNGSHTTFDIYSIDTDDIQYRSTYDNHQRVTFDNDSSGAFDLSLSITNNYPWISGQPNCLQDMIDDGLAIFAGGGGGGGSSTFAGLTDTPSTLTEGSGQYLKVSDDGQTIEYVDLPAGSVGGGSSSTISAVNQIQENIDNIPLIGSGVQIPDAILIKDINATTTNGNDNLIMLPFAAWSRSYDSNGNQTSSVQHFSYETNNGVGTRWYIQFDVEDGTYNSYSADQRVKKEFNSIQEYISNDRALYFGGGSSAGGGDSSSSGGSSSELGIGIGNLDYIKTLYSTGVSDSGVDDIKLRFSEQIPDAIVAKDGDGAGAYWDIILRLTDIGISAGGLQAWYVRHSTSLDGYYVYFDLNTEAGNYVNSSNIDISEFKTNAGLKDYIDEGRALYFGGGGGGGAGSSVGVTTISNFSEIIPDKINVPILRGSTPVNTQTRFFSFEGFFSVSTANDHIQFELNIGGSERYSINFQNDADGTWDGYVELDSSNTSIDFSKIPSAITNQPSLKEFINADRAIYYG